MAFINLLHNGYQGKLGETVGQKWKNQRTVRTYNPTNNSKSEAQLKQRAIYKQNISEASIAYSTLIGVSKNTAKGMNIFNLFTSQWSKAKVSTGDSWIKSGIFDRPNIGIDYIRSYSGGEGYFTACHLPNEVDLKKAKRFTIKGFFCTENAVTHKLEPITDNIKAIGVGIFECDGYGQVTDNGIIIQTKDINREPNKTLFQLTFQFNGKHYATGIIGYYLDKNPGLYQYKSVDYFWKSPYFS